jgi:hypothetical protein
MKDEDERITERLRKVRLKGPDPGLRERTLRAVREELSRERQPAGWRPWLARWRVELALVSGIAACLVLIPLLNGMAVPDGRDAPAVRTAEVERMVEQMEPLGMNGNLESYVRLRLAAAENARRREGSANYYETRRELEDWNL